ncbi:hypothetical protein Lalb_Chr22g0357661 [Lupinus albus]|uniref:Uncharacterized protein n=1 Tax=Lupinus albus TaxID=3870 RepID=A0A6A4N1V8_LUPAL|nr:hypothetical protein Lalb_Chr22g0357661 [Lupinus albus]
MLYYGVHVPGMKECPREETNSDEVNVQFSRAFFNVYRFADVEIRSIYNIDVNNLYNDMIHVPLK